MYTYNYNSYAHTYKDSSNKLVKKDKSILKAKFDFNDETALKDRHIIKERMCLADVTDYENLASYLYIMGFSCESPEKNFIGWFPNGEDRTLNIDKAIFGLKFNLKVTSNRIVPFEKLFDLKGLEDFILTGKMPEKKKD
jgi:hypothetical protein